ncbi:MAG: hypothetical protein K5655_04400 [Lachnospiraceae bacterium]|nr:hypothetical protein [Lachnospiraceae bacterium]
MGNVISEFGRLVLGVGRDIQCTVMPDYTSVDPGIIVQYTGETNANYINGYFYKCTNSGWVQENVQPETDVTGKANKVAGATTDDLASLTATGDLADSGKKLSDLVLKSDVKDVLNSTSTTDPLSANQGRVLEQQAEVGFNVCGAKNKLPYPWYETTKSANGLTFTDNGDGTLTLGTGTASADTYFEFCRRYDYSVFLENGTYICTGCPSGVPAGVLISNTNHDSVIFYIDSGNGVEMPINGTALGNTGSYVGMCVEVHSGTVISTPITFKPMIRDARILDPTFAPYAMTNRELTESLSKNTIGTGVDITSIAGVTTLQQDSYVVCSAPSPGDMAACKIGDVIIIYAQDVNTSQLFVRKGTQIVAWNAVGGGKVIYYPIT